MDSRLSRTAINFCLDCVLLANFVVLLAATEILYVVFPPGTSADGWTLLGWSYDNWTLMQCTSICVLTFGILLHLILHWTWVCGFVVGRLKRHFGIQAACDTATNTLYGVSLLVAVFVVLGSILLWAEISIVGPISQS